ncbi:unnamed protein product [Tetraodon nigroviridis]|uniref:(spotted green pufferfish) hypothetical protein n=1 Tax=Tetraodon nigroviridis TaxID=99883 RepID=Q4S3H1_TETNG|nr:unnamed protein product [Tetraodon nigroviridis]
MSYPGYPPQSGGYPPQAGGYPPQPGAFPPQAGGYPPQSGGWGTAPGGYGAVSRFFFFLSPLESQLRVSRLSSLCSQEELRRDTLEVPLPASPCRITPKPHPRTPPCLDMGEERHLILRHLPFL